MAIYNLTWIYIGTHADLDPGEPGSGGDGFYGINNPEILAGQTWSNADLDTTNDAAIIGITENDANNDGNIYDGDVGYEHIGYTPPGGSQTYSNVDSYTQWYATAVAVDANGNEFTFQPIVHVIQLANGATFIGQVENLDNYDFKSITLDSVYASNFTHFTPANSVDGSTLVTCFVAGTRILTRHGELAIEELEVGDLIETMDHGLQPIRWIGSSTRKAVGNFAPILIRKNALGNTRDLRVSPQHRMFFSSALADLWFNASEVLIAAKLLLNDHSIIHEQGGEVEYFHILFDTHEIIYAEGAPSESFHPGVEGWKALDEATRTEILALFPELEDTSFKSFGPSARYSLKAYEARLLTQTG